MYLIPFVRTNRAIAASLLYTEDPIKAIAISEIISVVGPFFNKNMYVKTISLLLAMMYNPRFSQYYITNYENSQNYYYQAEICSSLLFILTLAIEYI